MGIRIISRIFGSLAASWILSLAILGSAVGDGPDEHNIPEPGESGTAMDQHYQRARGRLAELNAVWTRSPAEIAALRPLVERLREEVEVLRGPGASVAVAKGPALGPVQARGSVVTPEEFEARARALRGTGLPTRARAAPPVRKDRTAADAEWLAGRARSAERVLIEMQTLLDEREALRRPREQKAFQALLDALGVILERAGVPPE